MKNNPLPEIPLAGAVSRTVFQQTLACAVTCSGRGLHSGQEVHVRFVPAQANTGIRFRRVDHPEAMDIPALAEYVIHTERTTVLGLEGQSVATVEHSLAALWAMEIDNAVVEIDGPEMPIFDGSSKVYIETLQAAGIQKQQEERRYLTIAEPLTVMDSKRSSVVVASPSEQFGLECRIDFQSKQVPGGKFLLRDSQQFIAELAHARTFVFFHELEYLLDQGLIKGGDLDCALVFAEHPVPEQKMQRLRSRFGAEKLSGNSIGLLNSGLPRYSDEPLRHKVLDAYGDLALAGKRIKGFISVDRPGHSINVAFARKLRELYGHD